MSDLSDAFSAYLAALRQTPPDQHTEHTGRAALEALLNAARDAGAEKGTVIQHEPPRSDDKGSPDFKVSRHTAILGYVEVKAFGADLDKVVKSNQIKKYRQLSPNLLVTDYLRFMWLKGDTRTEARLAERSALEGKPQPLKPAAIAEVTALLSGFFSEAPQGISAAKPLAEALAVRSHLLRDFLNAELIRQEAAKKKGKLHGLFDEFRRQVSHEITLGEFADAFAQTLAYGLFLARLNTDDAGTAITLDNVEDHVPASVGLIRELVGFLKELKGAGYADIRWVVEEVLSIINGLKLAAIHEDLAYRNRKAKRGTDTRSEEEWRLFSRDPFIYFYEDYLKAYDKSTRESRGVYYTPPPIVNFIVRAIDDILKDSFGIAQGLADRERVTVLDFACGTGTFLVEVLERIFETIGGEKSAKADGYVREHMLKNIFGFEYLIAPYTIAHLKLGQYLKDKGHPLTNSERLQVYLTNTLERIEPQLNALLPELSQETAAAQSIKEAKVRVITGNPPYSGHSRNNGPSARASINRYKRVFEVVGERELELPLGEKNPKWLQDDYVKFMSFAQTKMEATDDGIVAVITNHSFLDNPTFKGMRQSLTRAFDQLWFIDLHGNYNRGDISPDGHVDENVFDIKQGVAISLLVKKPGAPRFVKRADIWGRRASKYDWAAHTGLHQLEWSEVTPTSPTYSFVISSGSGSEEYAGFRSIRDIFSLASTGVLTARDHLTIHFDQDQLVRTSQNFIQWTPEMAREELVLGPDARDWRVEWAQDDLRNIDISTKAAREVAYRPFDTRFTFYTGKSRGFHCNPRAEVMNCLKSGKIALVTVRQIAGGDWQHVLAASGLIDDSFISNRTKERGYVFPLYTTGDLPDGQELALDFATARRRAENIAPAFRTWLDALYSQAYTPEQLLGYIYAVLHAPTYRARYADFLRTDFPRIPFPDANAAFEAMSALGWSLVGVHLLRTMPNRGLGVSPAKGSNLVEKVRWSEAEQKLWINPTQAFGDVPRRVWEFTIGGYQVLDKYLKSRKGRVLSLAEIEQVERIANVLDFTADQMTAIDAAYLAAFPEVAAEQAA